ncbi:hypothetical protein, partial [Stenotrophomonas maltophilia]
PTPNALSTTFVVACMVLLAWFVWRFLERPAHDRVRDRLTMLASRYGWPSRVRAGEARIDQGNIATPVEAGRIANR